MLVVVVYDIADDRRRLRLSNFLEGFGRRVQESVFECFIDLDEMQKLYKRVPKQVKPELDNYLTTYSPNLNLIERLWKFVKKQCLYSIYYADFNAFKDAISTCLEQCHTTHKKELDSSLTLRFQSFRNAKIIP